MSPAPENPDRPRTGDREAGLRDASSASRVESPAQTEATICAWIRRGLSTKLGISETEIDIDAGFVALGADSVALFSMTGQLAEWLDRDLPSTLLFEVSSIRELAAALAVPDETRRQPLTT